MPHDFKALQRYLLIGGDAGFLFCDGNLLLYGVYSVQIRKKETAPLAVPDDNPITLHIKILLGLNVLRLAEDIYVNLQKWQLFFADRTKSRITGGSADCVKDDLFREIASSGRNRADTASQLTVFMNGYKRSCAARP